MSAVLCFGEALIDFLQCGCDDSGNPIYKQFPGGAPANAAVAIAKLGGQAKFAGQVGSDPFGEFLTQALINHNVNIDFLLHHASAKTALAFVLLDDEGERSFSFHRHFSADVIITPKQIPTCWFDDQPIFHFCSNTLTDEGIAATTLQALNLAINRQCLISFDVNLRHNLWSTNKCNKELINQFVNKSHIIKFSADEFDYLRGPTSPEEYLNQCFAQHVELIIITNGANSISFCTAQYSGKVAVPSVEVVDTTAGGDSFIGALLFGLSQLEKPLVWIEDKNRLAALINFAAQCGAITVAQAGAFPALPTFSQVKKHRPLQQLGDNNEFLSA